MVTRRIRPLHEATPDERATAMALRRHVAAIAHAPRNLRHFESLQRTAAYIDDALRQAGYDPRHQTYEVAGEMSPTSKPSEKETASRLASS
jgi:hypothetical protein